MKKTIMLIAAMCMTSAITFAQEIIRVSTEKTDLVMKVSPKGRLYQVYLGIILPDFQTDTIMAV